MTFPRTCYKCGDTWCCNGCGAKDSNQCWCKKCLGIISEHRRGEVMAKCFPELKEVVIFT